jgi:hypothetical protein
MLLYTHIKVLLRFLDVFSIADFSFYLSDLVKEAQTTSRILNVFMKPKSECSYKPIYFIDAN